MYRQPKAIAIKYNNPLSAAAISFKNMALLLADFMYGTPERVRMTYIFACALALLGATMVGDSHQLSNCAVPAG
ncbi:MAG: hypothetical protein AB7L92_03570 [Alphaproteobacteria bacterium]